MSCQFKGGTDFDNTKFNDLADFWSSTFDKRTIFYKTDFNKVAVFSKATFKENVLFTYSLIGELLLLHRSKCEKGIDLSLAIVSGRLGLFDFKLSDYSVCEKVPDEHYEKYVSEEGIIPIKNKRETYRIIKRHHENQNNIVESLPFKKMEKETLAKELSLKSDFHSYIDRVILTFSKLSNNHGTSIIHSLLFILITGGIFFCLSLLAVNSDFEGSKFRYFIQFLIPTHSFDYMGSDVPLTTCFYLSDLLGRIFVGSGIYQFIQAFRKFR